ncbi:nitric oxide reductase transcriptional regulator NorR [Marinibactrum halimedae]|uniref:Regulatory protein LuxO n=1 Tax=Marinibactrum halimedae TaxID=1444977 RepID=A0AA37T1H5_9GAMM|nr:nitric oxide reductase transcriptional regulator NorR [Marinibactrum halimedae]MCD9460649.1 nitric oxide reductase transcriptional regulator NorR [Marinibactrum halimedae]GLS24294.1 regulatory protein LuxO [Marinibactrum halimedae]
MSEISSNALIELALDLTNNLTASDRFARLLSRVRSTITCDAVVLLKKSADMLIPLAQEGLKKDLMGRRFIIQEHPRFSEICASFQPIRFPNDSPLPDPYDGMLLALDGDLPIHACMGLPLFADEQLIGVLTLDSMTANSFQGITERTLTVISAMSSAALKTAFLLDQLEALSSHTQQVVTELTQEALTKDGGEIIGKSPSMEKLNDDIHLVAQSDFTVLIEGETGVGKELVARNLHQQSLRRDGPLVYVNCAALPESLVESELFGHIKGAFTGADRTRKGKFSLADMGTIFLDEIGEIPLSIQSKLLRVLQNKEIQIVGEDATVYVDVRVIAATNRNLEAEVEAGRFRADLFHRLTVYPIKVPPLRERRDDITLLAGYFCEQLRRKLGLQQLTLSSSTVKLLQTYHWPGNIRELEHVISRAALRAQSTHHSVVKILPKHIEQLLDRPTPMVRSIESTNESSDYPISDNIDLKKATQDFQRNLILKILHEEKSNWSATARKLNCDRSNLIRTAKRLGISVVKNIEKNHF